MSELKARWDQLDKVAQVGIACVAAVLAILFVAKLLPALVAAMGIGLVILLLFVPYWAPSIVAGVRNHPSKAGIIALNFFFGWTFVGWVVSLVWALSDNSARHHTVIVNTTVGPSAPDTQPPPPPASYEVGDVVNGHRFDGQAWAPVEIPPAPVPAEKVGLPSDTSQPTV
jgi:hypothetical protein